MQNTLNANTFIKKLSSFLPRLTFHVNGLDIPYTIVINPRRSTLYLAIYPDGRLEVETPGNVPAHEIIRFLHDEREWIYREYYRTLPECPPEKEEQILKIDDIEVPYLISRGPRNKRIVLKIHGNGTIEVCAPFDTPTDRISEFVDSKKEWIAQRTELPSRNIGKKPVQETAERTEITPAFSLPMPKGEETGQVTCFGHIIPYMIRRSNKAKRVTIKVDQNRNVRVISPRHVPATEISALMDLKANWIYSHTIASKRSLPPERRYQDGEVFPFMGRTITIRIVREDETFWRFCGDELIISVPGDFIEYHTKSAVRQAVSLFYKSQLYVFSIPYFEHYANLLQMPVPAIKIRDQKTKWGSCTPKNIILNLRLCMAPKNIIEYVIAHEIAHKVNPDHSPAFWQTVEQLMPDYRERREYLKKHGHEWVL